MSPEMVAENWRSNSLDLNNLPQDYYTRDATQPSADTSSSPGGYSKKKSGGARAEKEEAGKVYECRFCSLKFCKSQALGGHMNRHRQERETETLNKARQLVFSNDLAPPPLPHIGGYVSSGQAGGYHQASNINTDEPFRSIYPTTSRMFSTAPLIPPPPPQTMISYPSAPPPNNYYVGNVSCYGGGAAATGSYYTCIGAPVSTHGGGDRDLSLQDQVEGRNWGRR